MIQIAHPSAPDAYLEVTRDRQSEKYDSCNHYRAASTRSETTL